MPMTGTSMAYTYRPPMTPLPGQVAPALGGRTWDLVATIDRPAGANGVLYASGTENSGLSVFVQDDHLVFDYNCFGDHQVAVSDRPVPVGPSTIGVQFHHDGQGAVATLVIDDTPAGTVDIPFAMFMMASIGPSVGFDHGSAVSDHYEAPFAFAGDLQRVDIKLLSDRPPDEAAAADERAAMSRQ